MAIRSLIMYCSNTASANFSAKQGDDHRGKGGKNGSCPKGRQFSLSYMDALAKNRVKRFDDSPIAKWKPAINYYANTSSDNQPCLTTVVPLSVWEQSQKVDATEAVDAGAKFVPSDDLLEYYRHILGFIDKTR